VLSTATVTVPYTDIIVTLSTTESTSYETTTSYEEILETVTAYSATSIATVTEVATAPTAGFVKKRSIKKKRGCSKTSSQISTESTPEATSTPDATSTESTPEATSTSDATSTESTPETTSTPDATSSTSALFPVASNCADLAEYSSACACINAVSSTVTVTATPAASTEVTTVTESSAIPSTSTSVVTVVVSSTVVVPAETTLTATSTGLYQSTVTVTSTTTPVAPTQTSYWKLTNTSTMPRFLSVNNQYAQYNYSTTTIPTKLVVLTAGGKVALASDRTQKMYVRTPTVNYGVLWFQADAAAGSTDKVVTCTLAGDVVSCNAPTTTFDTLFNCGAYIYLGKSTWVQSGCMIVKPQLSNL
jgi:hypothetical protein